MLLRLYCWCCGNQVEVIDEDIFDPMMYDGDMVKAQCTRCGFLRYIPKSTLPN